MYRLIFGLATTTLIFGAASAHFWKEERAAREQNAALETRIEELERSQAEPLAQFDTVRNPFTQNPATVEATAPMQGAAPPEPQRANGRTQAVRFSSANASAGFTISPWLPADRTKLMEDPEYRDAMRAQQRMFMSSQYPDLVRALHLQPEEADKLMDLLADQQVDMMNRRPPFVDGAPDRSALQDWQREVERQQRDDQAQIAALLGESKLQEFKEYQKTLGARMQLKQLSGMLDGSTDPIRPDQMESLVAAVAQAQERRAAGLQQSGPFQGLTRPPTAADQLSMLERSIEETAQYNQRLHDAAAPYLSTRQIGQFDQMLNQQLQMQRVNLRMMRARADAEARGEIPPAQPGMLLPGMFQPVEPGQAAISSSAVIQSR